MLSALEVIGYFTANPAKVLGLAEPKVAPNCAANFFLFDPNLRWTYDSASGYSKSKNSPFTGRRLKGKTMFTLYNGEVVYHDESHAHGRLSKESVNV
jgi:dihydroorotase